MTPQPRAPETLTKKQRQRAAKREEEKATKVALESQRQERLAQHKRGLESARIAELYNRKGPSPRSVSGDMIASVNSDGKMIWD